MCSVLLFKDSNIKLKSMLSEIHYFDSVIFVFNGSRRYKFETRELGISSPRELLSPLGYGGLRVRPSCHYYVFPSSSNYKNGIDGLCGEVHRLTGKEIEKGCRYIFMDVTHRKLKILYMYKEEYRLEERHLTDGLYELKKGEKNKKIVEMSWTRFNEFLRVHKPRRSPIK